MTADLIEGKGGGSINTIMDTYTDHIDNLTNPVNGLICFINSRQLAVQIYNISTQKRSPWIKNLLLKGEQGGWCRPRYQFGFDPATNEHKLVCIRTLTPSHIIPYDVCEVLTIVGDRVEEDINSNELNQWRRIDQVPPDFVGNPSVYVNGSIYWSSLKLNKSGESWSREYRPVYIVAFDVGKEKFRTIVIPDFILDQPREHYKVANVDLLEVDGHLALHIKTSRHVVKLFICNDEKENMTTSNHQNWREVTINLPFYWRRDRFFCKYSILDQIILMTNLVESGDKEGNPLNKFEVMKNSFAFYSCNWKKNVVKKFEISGIKTQILNIWLFTTYSESLLPVPNLSNIANSS